MSKAARDDMISAPPYRRIWLPESLASAIVELASHDRTGTLRIGFVMGSVAWYQFAGGPIATLPRLRECATVTTMADETSDELRDEQRELTRVAALTGYVALLADIAKQIRLVAIAIGNESTEEGDDFMGTAAILNEAAQGIRSSAELVKAKIDEALARLSDNATATDIAAAVATLGEAKTALDAAGAAADTIDPTVTEGGGVVEDGSGGVVEAPPSA